MVDKNVQVDSLDLIFIIRIAGKLLTRLHAPH